MIRDSSDELHAFHARHFAKQVRERLMSTNGHRSEVTSEEVIELARSAKNAAKFEALWSGAVRGYASHSEADLALIGLLVRHTRDENQLDRLYRQSGLYRPKWDERHYSDGRTYGKATIEKALEGATEFYTGTDDEWEDPAPLPEGLPPVAMLDPAMIPEPLRGWIVDVSERMQIPPDFAAAGGVVVAGSLIGHRVGILPKRHDDWLVVPNLWGAVVSRPSLLKSPALAEIMKPIGRLIAEAYEDYQGAMLAFETDVMVAEATKSALKDELKKAAREAARSGDRSKLTEIASRSQDAEVPRSLP